MKKILKFSFVSILSLSTQQYAFPQQYEVVVPDFAKDMAARDCSCADLSEEKAEMRFLFRQFFRSEYSGTETKTRDFQDAKFFKMAPSLDPNRYALNQNRPAGISTIYQSYPFTTTQIINDHRYDLALCPIGPSIKSHLSPEGKLAAQAWNSSFTTLAGGPGRPVFRQFSSDADFQLGFAELCKKAGVQDCSDEFKKALEGSAANWDVKTEEKTLSKTETRVSKQEIKNKTKILTRLEPLIYFHFDIEKKIRNEAPYVLTPDSGGLNLSADDLKFSRATVKTTSEGKIILQSAGKSKFGYNVQYKDGIGIGAGPGIQTTVRWGQTSLAKYLPIGFYAGGMVVFSKARTLNRKVSDPSEASYEFRQIKYDPDTVVKDWGIGDSYSFETPKNIVSNFMLAAGMSFYGIATGPALVKGNSVNHIVTKIGPKEVIVEVADLNVLSLSGSIAGALLSYSPVLINDIKKAKGTYYFNLESPAAREAYNQMMSGNYFDAQMLAQDGNNGSVDRVADNRSKTFLDKVDGNDYLTSWYFGIPFIYLNFLTGKQTEVGYLRDFLDRTDSRYYHGIYLDNYQRRILFDHQYLTQMFYTGVENTGQVNMTHADSQDFYGRYVWNYQDESAKKGDLREKLNEMVYFRTGLEELDIDETHLPKDLGYVNAEVIVDIDQNLATQLYNTVSFAEVNLEMQSVINEFSKKSYSKGQDYCEPYLEKYLTARPDLNPEKIRSRSAAREYCLGEIRKNTSQVLGEIRVQLHEMSQLAVALDDNSKKKLAHSFREFGRKMMTDRFTFKVMYNLLKKRTERDFVRYTINGERLVNMVVSYPSGLVSGVVGTL
ncbi:MAG: hypothetical protein A4S09_12355 [Proteobacteria bacterium SG_bin7]|nr:MAG: hypothetical protein A4S09_12355 [Proteobacteria bacterium SG_bin7]